VSLFAADRVLRQNLDFGLKRGAACKGDLRVQHDQISDLDRLAKSHRVDRNGYDFLLCVAHAGQCAGLVHQFHDPSAMHIAEQVGMFRVHELRDRYPRRLCGLRSQGVCHWI